MFLSFTFLFTPFARVFPIFWQDFHDENESYFASIEGVLYFNSEFVLRAIKYVIFNSFPSQESHRFVANTYVMKNVSQLKFSSTNEIPGRVSSFQTVNRIRSRKRGCDLERLKRVTRALTLIDARYRCTLLQTGSGSLLHVTII